MDSHSQSQKSYEESYDLTPTQSTIIDEVHCRPYLYDSEEDEYMNRDLKRRAWTEIGSSLYPEMTGKEVKDEFRKLRTKYFRVKWEKHPPGRGASTKPKKWIESRQKFMMTLSFADNPKGRRKTSGNYSEETIPKQGPPSGGQGEVDDFSTSSDSNSEEDDFVTSSDSDGQNDIVDLKPPAPLTKNHKNENRSEKSKMKTFQERALAFLEQPEDGEHHMGMVLANSLRKLPTQDHKNQAFSKLMQVMTEFGKNYPVSQSHKIWSPASSLD